MKISERLKAIADMVPAGVTLADIGTDHAYLPIYLTRHKVITCAIAGDIHQGPYLSAKNAVESAGLTSFISVRLGNGLDVVKPGEAEVVVIAGMGGSNIIDILSSRPEVTAGLRRLILQPMLAAASVRKWLHDNGWRIAAEQLVREDGRLYQVIAAEQGESAAFDPIFYDIGPLLWQTRNVLLLPHLNELIDQIRGVLGAMRESPGAMHSGKYQELTNKLNKLEEKRICL
ncbi:tRNA (adenine(22)-N(1))-methyltransferase [Sporomusa acidovorans]|uniref:tRNA (Adenine(22)-N(1))-methyltransferase n=1 Tax=Sporomusa acidovorans (strain ATCC 49682 / DSM 3132 / Mol) TaxID=1123286 RepID=A0ABZ3J4J7_SPOA4|nr:class I SAM-dependent methyltransferase [Sporomusa acidovorans]OZC20953.1 tRNA (adenine(22)-N(1))-methyltransferase [Sporomusa acidovorans DSM 3132]SDE62165.1 tRNA (adenine22-N1)-methyltransferase [Sporomusa acidovorans]